MKIFIVLMLFNFITFAQPKWVKRATHLSLSIAYPIIAANTEWQQFKEKTTTGLERKGWASKWHTTQWYERATGFAMAMSIPLHTGFDLKQTLADSFLSGVLFWNIYDGVLNVKRGQGFYYSSQTTPSSFRHFDFLKIPLLIIALGLYFIL